MAVFKCKICGGTIEFEPGASVGVCEYCGTRQTLPRLDDDRRANLYDRANHFRRNNDYDKAAGIYEQILNEDRTDAEAYWSLVLCRYGVEYVEDPVSHKRVPTVNRTQFTSVFADEDYRSALQYADAAQKAIYEDEAKRIDEIQRGILSISEKEEPFDVFICYKETDQNGRRTQDSVLANDLYHQLTQEGFKVFFSRITLEDKLGTAYEPYIFAALNSSKAMVVLGTKPEYFNAVWVKNEWSRYLSLVKQSGGKKVLIPAYRDMDPYDLPEEFSHLQAQDMGKLGFMQDLIRGIRKIVRADAPEQAAVRETAVSNSNANTASLLKRAFMFLEDGDWKSANEYCERVLDIDPENAQAYLGKLMAGLKVKRQEELKNCKNPFDRDSNFGKVMQFGDESLKSTLFGYVKHIYVRNSNERRESIYKRASNLMLKAGKEENYKEAAELFDSIRGYQDSSARAEECRHKAEEFKANLYDRAVEVYNCAKDISEFEKAKNNLSQLHGYKDCDALVQKCERSIQELIKEKKLEEKKEAEALKLKAEKEKKKKKRTIIIAASLVVTIVIATKSVSLYVKNTPYRELAAALEDGSFSSEWVSSSGTEVVSAYDKKGLDVVANKLGEYHANNDAEKALALLTTLMERGIKIDGERFYASSSFIDWIKETAISEGRGTNDGVNYNYEVMGYKIEWDARYTVNQFYLYIPIKDDWRIVAVTNSNWNIPTSEKSCIN